jgi:hypothetical protein
LNTIRVRSRKDDLVAKDRKISIEVNGMEPRVPFSFSSAAVFRLAPP